MSERTTIGGTVYEAIGSSSSNLLLKCNGTARIQWGGKLIDLIKNGKLAFDNDSVRIHVVTDESGIKSDGIYILSQDDQIKILISKNNQHYNVSGTELYISATTKQEITAEQKQQAGENMGLYFKTLTDVKNSNIKNGIFYTLDTRKLYSINDGVLEEFLLESVPVSVEENTNNGKDINSSTQIVKGMIMMYSGTQPVPEGWALCDGLSHTYKNTEIVTPNLKDKFLKLSDNTYEIVFIIKL